MAQMRLRSFSSFKVLRISEEEAVWKMHENIRIGENADCKFTNGPNN